MKILFTGGGSAGHVTPNIALIEKFSADGWSCVYVGSKQGIESTIIPPLGISYFAIASGKLRRYFDWQNFVDPFFILLGIFQSLVICLRQRPDVLFSKGGFVAFPVVIAAWLTRIPVVCHESDVTPGLANKLCFPFSDRICVNFEQTRSYLKTDKVTVTGTPLRASLLEGDALRGRGALGLDNDRAVILVFGGSLGATVVNEAIRSVLDQLLERFVVVHATGSGNIDASLVGREGYIQREFFNEDFGDVLAAADIAIARAGANSIYELLVTRTPHILIPLSARASRGDQLINAETFAEAGYSHVITEEELTSERLLAAISRVHENRDAISTRLENYLVRDSTLVISDLVKAIALNDEDVK